MLIDYIFDKSLSLIEITIHVFFFLEFRSFKVCNLISHWSDACHYPHFNISKDRGTGLESRKSHGMEKWKNSK